MATIPNINNILDQQTILGDGEIAPSKSYIFSQGKILAIGEKLDSIRQKAFCMINIRANTFKTYDYNGIDLNLSKNLEIIKLQLNKKIKDILITDNRIKDSNILSMQQINDNELKINLHIETIYEGTELEVTIFE